LLTAGLLATIACAGTPRVQVGPPPLGLAPPAVHEAYLAAQAAQLKLRHQVALNVSGEQRLMTGVLVIERPSRFWVRAMTPVGVSLFELRAQRGRPAQVTTAAEAPADPRAAQTLRQDIERIYLLDCPPDARAHRNGPVVEVKCDLADSAAGDEALQADLTPGGVLLAKRFLRGGIVTASITYGEYSEADGRWWPRRITLSRTEMSYRLSIALTDADPNFDTTRVFAPSGE
jgi:hypothetical protein